MKWDGTATVTDGVRERRFIIERDGDRFPGYLWTKDGATPGPVPLVLVGHGGRSHKKDPKIMARAGLLVRREGFAAAVIDGIEHGERGAITNTTDDDTLYRAMWRNGPIDRMVADWQATLDALSGLDEIDAGRGGYWGLSMGTMFGLPFVAAESRVKAAVLGLCGLEGSSAVRGHIVPRHIADAPKVTVPVQFFAMLDDERFAFTGTVRLFRMLGTKDKRFTAYPGLHADSPPECADTAIAFLAERLRGA
ncbi:MAG: dienelactone hydrolase family protein [Dehalococcoidia bacterium]|nr:dienelactone hydrolase family protein [Dehalococcoidia bacterium]